MTRPFPAAPVSKGSMFLQVLRTTDHKLIGRMYLVTSFVFFMIGGVMALIMRAELARPGMQFLSPEQYNQLFTMHGTIMLLFFATPSVFAFANLVLPLQIGSPDVAFPRLNAFSYWLYVFGATFAVAGFATPGGAADGGWTFYLPLNDAVNSPSSGTDFWIIGLAISGLGTILGGVNMVTTVITLRAPGMTHVPDADLHLEHPGHLAADPAGLPDPDLGAAGALGGSTSGRAGLCQPERWRDPLAAPVLVLRPPRGLHPGAAVLRHRVRDLPGVRRKPCFGYKGLVLATLSIGALSLTVWAHHMFATGAVLLPFFSFMSFLIAVPTGLKFFNWIGTMWKGSITFETPMLFSIGFLVTFLFGGLTGVVLASPPIDFQVSDTYFVVAHFHYVLFGTIVFAAYAGVYFWFPKFTGRYMNERMGKLHFWLTFIGFHTTFLVQHWLGAEGMPRRYADYLPGDGFTTLNTISSIGAFILGASMLPFLYNVYHSYRYGEIATADDPWGHGNSLEWATSCPPPRHNFTSMPRIRSERPAFEAHYPHLLEQLEREAHADKKHRTVHLAGAAAVGGEGAREGHRDTDPGTG